MPKFFNALFIALLLMVTVATSVFASTGECTVTSVETTATGWKMNLEGCTAAQAAAEVMAFDAEIAKHASAAASADLPKAPVDGPEMPASRGIGQCEGLHDYQLQDLEEISADVEMIHVQFHTGGAERETLLPAGRYPVMKSMKGHVWELGPDCTFEQALERHVMPSIDRRQNMGVNNAGYVAWEDFVKDGYVSIAWQPEGTISASTAEPEASEPSAVSCEGVESAREPQKGVPFKFNDNGGWVIINAWTNEWADSPDKPQDLGKIMLMPEENPDLLVGGAYWTWPAEGCNAEFNAALAANGKTLVTAEDLRDLNLVK